MKAKELFFWPKTTPFCGNTEFTLDKSLFTKFKNSLEAAGKTDPITGKKKRDFVWNTIMFDQLALNNPYCVFTFTTGHKYIPNPKYKCSNVFKTTAYCKFSSCKMSCTITLPRSSTVFTVRYDGVPQEKFRHLHNESRSNVWRSHKRKEAYTTICNTTLRPSAVELQNLSGMSKEKQASGNMNGFPSLNVFKQLLCESRSAEFPFKDDITNLKLMHSQQSKDKLIGYKFFGTIRQIMAEPLGVILFSEPLLQIFKQRIKVDIAYLDATGSIIIKTERNGTFYVYQLLIRHPLLGGTPIAVASFLTNSHNVPSITNFLKQFVHHLKKYFVHSEPKLLVCDGSVVLSSSLLDAFNDESPEAYRFRCYAVLIGKATCASFVKSFVHLCGSHKMKTFRELASLVPSHYNDILHILGRFMTCKMLPEVENLFYHFGILLLSTDGKVAENALSEIQKFVINYDDLWESDKAATNSTQVHSANDGNEEYDIKKLDFDSNIFLLHFKSTYQNILLNVSKQKANGDNTYYSQELFIKFCKLSLNSVHLWSALLLGDLSRHKKMIPQKFVVMLMMHITPCL